MPPQALVVYPRSQSPPLAALNRSQLLASVAPLSKLATVLDAFLTRANSALLETSLEEAREATAKAFLGPLVLLARRGLIEGVYSSDVGDVSPSEALLMERWVPIDDSETGWQHVHINMA